MLGRMQRPVLSFGGDTTALLLCLRRYASQEDTIYLTGGGNMGTLYRNEEEYRLRLISARRSNRIILFPQTMSYGGRRTIVVFYIMRNVCMVLILICTCLRVSRLLTNV